MTEQSTPRGFEIKCDAKKCRRYILSNFDPVFGKQYARNHATASGYVRKGDYWLCGEHKHLTEAEIEGQWEKKKGDEEDD